MTDVLAVLFALPVPYSYDLAGVSARLVPSIDPRVFAPPPGFGWPFSSQVAFERIHDVWASRDPRAPSESVELEESAVK